MYITASICTRWLDMSLDQGLSDEGENRWMQRTSIQSLYEHLVSYQAVWGLAVLETVETVGRDDDGGQRRRKVNDGVIIQRHPVCHFGHRQNKKKRKKEVLISFRLLLKRARKAPR